MSNDRDVEKDYQIHVVREFDPNDRGIPPGVLGMSRDRHADGI